MKWSVVICTVKPVHYLLSLFEHLSFLECISGDYEIIVVTNGDCSTPSQGCFPVVGMNARVVIANAPLGLSCARNKAVSIASGDFVAFIDDDAWPDARWLVELEKAFANPIVGGVGGKVLPVLPDAITWPEWLHEKHRPLFSVIEEDTEKYFTYPDYPVGTNMAFRRSIFSEVGSFSHLLGRKGESLLSMEETEFCLRVSLAGFQFVYRPQAVVHHSVAESRLNPEWLERRAYYQGVSAAIVEVEHINALLLGKYIIKRGILLLVLPLYSLASRMLRRTKATVFARCQMEMYRGYFKGIIGAFTSEP